MESVPPPGSAADELAPTFTVAGAPAELTRRRMERRRERLGPEASRDAYDATTEKGVVGEERVGADLEERLAGSGCVVVHSIQFLRFGDIDHLVIGPGGITVIDAKNWSGEITVRDGMPVAGGWRKPKEVEKLYKQVTGVRLALLHAPIELRNTPVRGLMCLAAEPERPVTDLHAGLVLSGSHAAAEIAARAGELNAGRIQVLYRTLIDRLPRVTRLEIDEILAPSTAPPAPSPVETPPAPRVAHDRSRPRQRGRPASTRPGHRRRSSRRSLQRDVLWALLTLIVVGVIVARLPSLIPTTGPHVSELRLSQRAHRLRVRFTATAGPVRLKVRNSGRATTVVLQATGEPQVWLGPRTRRGARSISVTACIPTATRACQPGSVVGRRLTLRERRGHH